MRLAPLEAVLNRNIAASGAARGLCTRLAGKVLTVRFTGLPLALQFESDGERMKLDTSTTATANATLTGTPLSLLQLASPRPEAALRTGAVHIEGDAEVAQTFSELLKHARPDLEEELSRVIGDVAAHQVGNAARSVLAFGRRTADTFAQNVAEFLQEEGRDVPARVEADEFIAGVDKLRDDVDRFEARLARLERQGS
ncbi:MAG TPA: SCP2 sterol-binding domain-containing protein [Povalibacter sp.]|uniref:ubiquinone biosynthesis accessory factor UbiJ n=1 Tax=Povalibacter sp. TaxID=1962978 RepID=UPI002B59612F|nr:SCP2 sterol-binding domain-containing protein [Povalibacter sp.]HMN44253.1 SCP2 sterol-binding domain-containing protein [Povalibacter sp.]